MNPHSDCFWYDCEDGELVEEKIKEKQQWK